jgi:hypothetical protein
MSGTTSSLFKMVNSLRLITLNRIMAEFTTLNFTRKILYSINTNLYTTNSKESCGPFENLINKATDTFTSTAFNSISKFLEIYVPIN